MTKTLVSLLGGLLGLFSLACAGVLAAVAVAGASVGPPMSGQRQ